MEIALVCKQRFNFEDKVYFPGEVSYQIERVAKRWVSRGLCDYADPNMVRRDYTKHDKVSIVILVKDALDYVKLCIDTLLKCTSNFELIIVDNASKDETKEYLKSINCPEYTIITNLENLGVSYGWNQGIKIAKYDYICLLNSDTLLTPDWLKKLMRGFKYSADIGMVGPSSNGGPTVWGPQVVGNVDVEKINEYAQNLPDVFIEAPVVGFCFIIAKKVFDKIGVFDYKRYDLACYEDIDFIWRAVKSRFKTLWCKGSYVHHFGNRTMIEMGIDVQGIRNINVKIIKERYNDSNLYIENDVESGHIEVISDKKVKIGFVTYAVTHKGADPASTRIRVTWPLKYLNAIVSESFDELVTCNVVVFQTRYSQQDVRLAKTLKLSNVRIIFDNTDPHWLKEYQREDVNFVNMVELADIVTLPTEGLVETFKKLYSYKQTFIIKDRLDLNIYNKVKKHVDKKSYKILWHGSHGNLNSIDLARVDLEKLGLEFDITLVCIFDGITQHSVKPFQNVTVIPVEWTNQNVIDELLKSDVSINPRYDNWKSYKSNNKTITAWACGIPCTERDFYDGIKKYLSNTDLRNEEAKTQRAIIEKDYDVKLTAKEWTDCVSKLIVEPLKPAIQLKSKDKIVVYTSICGNRDVLREDQFIGEADYIAFIDKPIVSKVWNVKKVFNQFIDPSREAKIFKVLPYQYLDYRYSIWIDGSIAIKVNPVELIDEFLAGYDIALFKHAARDDIYEEYIADFRHRTYEPKYLRELQQEKYLKEGFPKHSGLFECGVIIRRHSEAVKRCMETWWSEVTAFSVSDQCSFIYAVKKHDIKVNTLPGSVWNNIYFNLIGHARGASL